MMAQMGNEEFLLGNEKFFDGVMPIQYLVVGIHDMLGLGRSADVFMQDQWDRQKSERCGQTPDQPPMLNHCPVVSACLLL